MQWSSVSATRNGHSSSVIALDKELLGSRLARSRRAERSQGDVGSPEYSQDPRRRSAACDACAAAASRRGKEKSGPQNKPLWNTLRPPAPATARSKITQSIPFLRILLRHRARRMPAMHRLGPEEEGLQRAMSCIKHSLRPATNHHTVTSLVDSVVGPYACSVSSIPQEWARLYSVLERLSMPNIRMGLLQGGCPGSHPVADSTAAIHTRCSLS